MSHVIPLIVLNKSIKGMLDKKFLIIYNPQTGRKGLRSLDKLISGLVTKNYTYDIHHTEADSFSTEHKIRDKLKYYTDIISIGGDGTLNMLSNVLASKEIPLGIIPCGTGNDFSRHIYNKKDDIFSIVIGDKTKKVDLGWCNERYFINVLGIGYDAMITEETKDDNKKLFRSVFYLWNALKYLPFYKEKQLKIKSENLNKDGAVFMAAFGNGSFFGSGMNIAPQADISDGLLDCCWIGKLTFLQKIICVVKIFSGKHLAEDNIEYVKGKEFKVLTEGEPIEADGEFVGYTPATICIKEKSLLLKMS